MLACYMLLVHSLTTKVFGIIGVISQVLYDDVDVEVLRLEKERWELVDNGRKQKQV